MLLEQVHERLIIQELQLQMAERAGIRVSDTELNASFQSIAENNQLSIEEFLNTLLQQNQVK